jgi:hypothetical protein
MQSVRVRILHMEGCFATPPILRLVREIAGAVDVPIILETVLVETPEQAQTLGFLGSPSVRVEGRDIEPAARDRQDFGLT